MRAKINSAVSHTVHVIRVSATQMLRAKEISFVRRLKNLREETIAERRFFEQVCDKIRTGRNRLENRFSS